MQENWHQRYGALAMDTLFIQGRRCIAGALFTKGIAHRQAPCKPGALVLWTWMCERAQQSFPSSWLRDGDEGRLQPELLSLTSPGLAFVVIGGG